MVETALTAEQQQFADDRHGLVYAFLNKNRLNPDDFYDIVIFGYLRAVRKYFNEPELSQKYAFSTIAWYAMRSNLYNHYRSESRLKRKAFTISLESPVYGGGEVVSLQETVSVPDTLMLDFETELHMLELASRVSEREMDVIRMKVNGYGTREIAKAQHMPMKGVCEMLAGLHDTALAVCYK